MGSEMQERVARALLNKTRVKNGFEPCDLHDVEDGAEWWLALALAAMEAMREPTQVMVNAAPASYSESFQVIWPKICSDLFRTMLDAEIEAAKKGG